MGTTIVHTKEEAARVVEKLRSLTDRFHAIDTEVRGWTPGQTPYGNGEVTCFSVYCGDDVDFGSGPRLWVDNLDGDGDNCHLVGCFREYFEDPKIRKVFQNYSFDVAQLANEGVSVAGFARDTLHMARLEHSDRPSYSLEKLGDELLGSAWRKRPFKEVLSEFQAESMDDLHLSPKPGARESLIDYSTFDTVVTWKLHEHLAGALAGMPWQGGGSMLDLYDQRWAPLAEVLVGIEARGFPVDEEWLQEQERMAAEDRDRHASAFHEWVSQQYAERYADEKQLEGAPAKLALGTTKQMEHLLFGKEVKAVGPVKVGGLKLPKKLRKPAKLPVDELIRKLAGDSPESGEEGCGPALKYLGQDGCAALSARCRAKDAGKRVDSLRSLREHVDPRGRVHGSMNIQKGTGRLTTSSPRLKELWLPGEEPHSQAAVVRCAEGRRLVVADYRQLHLRVMAHVAHCKKMTQAMNHGVDVHSATAATVFPHVHEALQRGEVRLGSVDGDGEVPLLRDVFGSERQRAKALSLGIACGKDRKIPTLAKELGCTKEECKEMIERWHRLFPEVQRLPSSVVSRALTRAALDERGAYVTTLGGRRQRLPVAPKERLQRYAIWMGHVVDPEGTYSPIQGGAADVLAEAMLKTHGSEELQRLGFAIVLQARDELVFEGPAENASAALPIVRRLMEQPFADGSALTVPLPVDAEVVAAWPRGDEASLSR